MVVHTIFPLWKGSMCVSSFALQILFLKRYLRRQTCMSHLCFRCHGFSHYVNSVEGGLSRWNERSKHKYLPTTCFRELGEVPSWSGRVKFPPVWEPEWNLSVIIMGQNIQSSRCRAWLSESQTLLCLEEMYLSEELWPSNLFVWGIGFFLLVWGHQSGQPSFPVWGSGDAVCIRMSLCGLLQTGICFLQV